MNKEIANLRDVIVKLTQMLAGQGLTVTQQGSSAYVKTNAKTLKPEVVNIPYLPDNASPKLIMAIQGFIDHEIAHVLFTDWSVVKKAVALGRGVDSLQNIVEDTFIEREVGKKFPGAVYNLDRLHEFFISDITTPALNKPEIKGNPMAEFSVLLVPICRAWSGQKVFQDWLTKNKHWEHPVVKAFIDRVDPKVIASFPDLINSQQCLDVALELNRAINDGKKKPSEAEGEGEGSGTPKKDPHGEKSESKKSGAKASDAKPEKGDKEESENDDGDDAEGPASPAEGSDDDAGDESDAESAGKPEEEADEEADGDGESSSGSSDAKEDGEADADGGARAAGKSGDEADDDSKASGGRGDKTGLGAEEPDLKGTRYNTTMEDSDKVFEPTGMDFAQTRFEGAIEELITNEAVRATKGAPYRIFSKDFDVMEKYVTQPGYRPNMLVKLEDETRGMIGVMQKDIERMMAAKSQTLRVPGYRSGRLHSAGLHKLVTGDDRIFRRTHEQHSKATAVSLLIDNSGSMGGAKMETAMKIGFALSQTLERVGIAHEVLGFTTCDGTEDYNANVIRAEAARLGVHYSRTEPVYMPIFKEFSERLTPAVKSRFACAATTQTFLMNNIDGEAVEIATQRLLKRPEKRRVLLVLSDGNPACAGDTRQVNSHLHKVIEDAQKQKVDLVGIGIQSSAVSTYYPKSFVIHRLEDLPRTVMGELKRILTAA